MDNINLENIDYYEIGQELQKARIKRGLNQSDAAKIINVARTTLTAIENGDRKIKAEELIKLAKAYGHKVNDFMRPRPDIEPFQVQFRSSYFKKIEDEHNIQKHIDQLEEYSRNYLELENITKSPLKKNYPNEFEYNEIKSNIAAEILANEERMRLGIVDGPIPSLRELLEQDIGLRIFYISFEDHNFSAIYFFEHNIGGCIAINKYHPEERRRWSLAHEYGHFLAHRYQPTVFIEDIYSRVPEKEKFADQFAANFLMPANGLRKRFNQILQSNDEIKVSDILILANYYDVSVSAMTIRLEDLDLLPTGTWDKIKESGFKIRDAQADLGISPKLSHEQTFPMRYIFLAINAYENDLISEGQLSNFLDVDRLRAREIVHNLESHTSGVTQVDKIELNLSSSIN